MYQPVDDKWMEPGENADEAYGRGSLMESVFIGKGETIAMGLSPFFLALKLSAIYVSIEASSPLDPQARLRIG